MDTISSIENLLGDFFKVLNGLPDYIAIEENEEETDFYQGKLKEKLKKLIDIGFEWRLKRISALIKELGAEIATVYTAMPEKYPAPNTRG